MPKRQTTNLTPRDVAPHAYRWNCEQLEEMKAIIDGLLAVQVAADPEEDKAPGTQSQQWGPRGGAYIERKLINGYGPYEYLRFKQEGKYKSVYVGKVN